MNKKKGPLTEENKKDILNVKFNIFDCMMSNIKYCNRNQIIKDFFDSNKNIKHCVKVKTEICNDYKCIEQKLTEYIGNKYEGLIIRNSSGLYEKESRSKYLLKYKLYDDNEYKIINFSQGEGTEAGCVIWKCITPCGYSFDVRPSGSFEERKILYKNGKDYINKLLTVRHFGFLEKTDIPRIGVGVAIRDYE